MGRRRRRRVFHVDTAGPLAKTLDMRDFVDSFDITGRLEAGQIAARQPFFGPPLGRQRSIPVDSFNGSFRIHIFWGYSLT